MSKLSKYNSFDFIIKACFYIFYKLLFKKYIVSVKKILKKNHEGVLIKNMSLLSLFKLFIFFILFLLVFIELTT